MTVYPTFRLETNLLKPYQYIVLEDCFVAGLGITVKAGTYTNLTTVPRLFWSIIPPHGATKEPSIVHDYLIRSGVSKQLADTFFLYLLLLSVSEWQAVTMFLSIRIFKRVRNKLETKIDVKNTN
jgi:hypothetical protein